MEFKNLKIGTQLKIGFGIILFFVAFLGVVAYYQTDILHIQTETLYEHPLKVRRAIGEIKADVLSMNRDMKDLLLTDDDSEISEIKQNIEQKKDDAFKQIAIVQSQYLGPKMDVENLNSLFIKINTLRVENISLIEKGKKAVVLKKIKNNGEYDLLVDDLLVKIEKISVFALNKGDEIYKTSFNTNNSLNRTLIIVIISILLLSFLMIFLLNRSIKKPLLELIRITSLFKDKNFSVRSNYSSENEFGLLSASYNEMADIIESAFDLNRSSSQLADVMLSEDDAHKFFKILLSSFLQHTNAQMGAVYLLDDKKTTFNHFESIGLDKDSCRPFSLQNNEAEFGKAILTKRIQHIKEISKSSRFYFETISGKFNPAEIITIPIFSNDLPLAVISLATISYFSEKTIRLLDSNYHLLTARINGVLNYKLIVDISERLEIQNKELEAQKTELNSQTQELSEQNTELEMQKKQLDEANKLKSVFLSNMSHELRTPLNSVIALSGVLNRRLKGKIESEEYSFIDVIERNGKHLLTLINDILDLSRIEAGKEDVELNSFNINDLLNEIVELLKPQAIQKHLNLVFFNNVDNLIITSDHRKCQHILQNLITNAIKFTEKGKIEISVVSDDKFIEVQIADTGIGISEDELNHIFDEFRQADGSTSRKYGGTGLGLAIARKYAKLIEGEIKVKSEKGAGSVFSLRIPSDMKVKNNNDIETSDTYKSNSEIARVVNAADKTILLVEDSDAAVIQLTDILTEEGYKIKVARNGKDALEIIAKELPDAMILDLMMPEVDGFTVLKNTREHEESKKLPVIILTAKHISKGDYDFFKTNNIIQLIQKGDINKVELLNAVARMLIPKKETIEIAKPIIKKIIGKPKILVVEDNADNLLTVKALLEDKYIIFEAIDGFVGYDLTIKHKPDLILMDIALPEMNGIDVFLKIRRNEDCRHIPVVVLTASAMKGEKEKILSYGFDGYISKPIDSEILFKTLNTLLYGE